MEKYKCSLKCNLKGIEQCKAPNIEFMKQEFGIFKHIMLKKMTFFSWIRDKHFQQIDLTWECYNICLN